MEKLVYDKYPYEIHPNMTVPGMTYCLDMGAPNNDNALEVIRLKPKNKDDAAIFSIVPGQGCEPEEIGWNKKIRSRYPGGATLIGNLSCHSLFCWGDDAPEVMTIDTILEIKQRGNPPAHKRNPFKTEPVAYGPLRSRPAEWLWTGSNSVVIPVITTFCGIEGDFDNNALDDETS